MLMELITQISLGLGVCIPEEPSNGMDYADVLGSYMDWNTGAAFHPNHTGSPWEEGIGGRQPLNACIGWFGL